MPYLIWVKIIYSFSNILITQFHIVYYEKYKCLFLFSFIFDSMSPCLHIPLLWLEYLFVDDWMNVYILLCFCGLVMLIYEFLLRLVLFLFLIKLPFLFVSLHRFLNLVYDKVNKVKQMLFLLVFLKYDNDIYLFNFFCLFF